MQQVEIRRSDMHSWHWTKWLISKPFDWVSTFLYLCVPALFVYERMISDCGCSDLRNNALLLAGVSLILIAIDRVESWGFGEAAPPKYAAILLILRVILIQIAVLLDGFNFSAFLYLLLPFMVLQSFGNRASYVLSVGIWLLDIVQIGAKYPHWYWSETAINQTILFTMGVIFVVTMAKVVQSEKCSRTEAEKLLRELELSHRQLTAYMEQVAELATTKERNRLAREIHDSLGHYLTVINVQIEKALAYRDKKPDEATQAMRDAKRLATDALQDIRRSVGALRSTGEVFSLGQSLRDMVDHHQNSPCAIDLELEGREDRFSKQSLIALYRVVQEGLTNIQKHAGAAHASIKIALNADQAVLSIRDDGCGFDPLTLQNLSPDREGTFGLQGLHERLELVGGNLTVESQPGRGTHLRVIVPSLSPVQQPSWNVKGG
jgi:signal transduction histidine kinase